jgi:cytochrome c oxidase cbb3-type subunit 3
MTHKYDDIEELDNPLPLWWLGTFFGTIIFAFLYWLHYEIAGGPDQKARLEAHLAAIQSLTKTSDALAAEDFWAAVADETKLTLGGQVFQRLCASCHAPQGEGLIGPNLTDLYWIHGTGKLMDVTQVIAKGVGEKGMPSWETILTRTELVAVAAYAFKLSNRNLPGKAPEGQLVELETR